MESVTISHPGAHTITVSFGPTRLGTLSEAPIRCQDCPWAVHSVYSEAQAPHLRDAVERHIIKTTLPGRSFSDVKKTVGDAWADLEQLHKHDQTRAIRKAQIESAGNQSFPHRDKRNPAVDEETGSAARRGKLWPTEG